MAPEDEKTPKMQIISVSVSKCDELHFEDICIRTISVFENFSASTKYLVLANASYGIVGWE